MERRHLLRGVGTVAAVGLTGCLGGDTEDDTEEPPNGENRNNTENRATVFVQPTDEEVDQWVEQQEEINSKVESGEITREEADEQISQLGGNPLNNAMNTATEQATSRGLEVVETSDQQLLVSGPSSDVDELLDLPVVTRIGSADEFNGDINQSADS